MTHSPPLGLTMGDPAGIGPEILMKSVVDLAGRTPLVALGHVDVFKEHAQKLGLDISIRSIGSMEEWRHPDKGRSKPELQVVQTGSLDHVPAFGKVDAACGQAAFDAVVSGITLAKAGKISGIVTAPLHKEALSAAGVNFPGHTEMLAYYCDGSRVAMMLMNNDLKVVLVTIHCSLRSVVNQINIADQLETIRIAHRSLKLFGFEHPRIAVAGLNPHAGENGLFGPEEGEVIIPAIKATRNEGIDVSGPFPGDTVFMQAREGQFDVVVAQYHDQGLIPIKYGGLDEGVNVTLGLPIVRTSPDHGTAFDIAGQGIARPDSMQAAISAALTLQKRTIDHAL